VQRAVRHGRWKLIRYPQINRTQLFDLQEDPYELKDLSGDPAQAGRIKELVTRLEEQQRLFGDRQSLSVEKPRPAEVNLQWFQEQTPQKPQKAKRPKKTAKGAAVQLPHPRRVPILRPRLRGASFAADFQSLEDFGSPAIAVSLV